MRVLLVNSNRLKQPWPVLPFGLCCVASSVKAAGHDVKVLDLCFSRKPERDMKKALAAFRPEAVGVTVRNIDNASGYHTHFELDDVKRDILDPLKRLFAGPIVIGGPAAGINAREMLELFGLDYAIRGDGEAALVELLRRWEANEDPTGMAGLVRRENGVFVDDNPPMRVRDLDALPPARVWRWLDTAPYARAGSPLQVQTKRGCPLHCAYCTYNSIEGRAWRLRDPRKVVDEIEEAVRESGIRAVEIADSVFNMPLDHAKAVLRELAERKLDAHIETMGLTPAAMDEELVDLLKAAGFRDLDLGVESASNATLRGLGKTFDRDAVLNAGRLLHARGIPIRAWTLLLGGPGETRETLRETFETVAQAADPWDLVTVGIGMRLYNGSPATERLRGEYAEAAKDNFLRPVSYRPEAIGLDEIKALAKRETLRHSNWMLWDEGEGMNTPLALLVATNALLKRFAPNQPIWRLFVVLRRLQMWTGVNAVKRLRHEIKCRKFQREATGNTVPGVRCRVSGV